MTVSWLLGGTMGLETVGGQVERLARERSGAFLAVGVVTLVAKLAASWLALVLGAPGRERRYVTALGFLGGTGLALYGGVLVVVGALALGGVLDPSGHHDEHALRWHVYFWDLWFLVWGLSLALAAVRARRRRFAGARRT